MISGGHNALICVRAFACGFRRLKRFCRAFKACAFRGLQTVFFQRSSKASSLSLVFLNTLKKLSPLTFLRVKCFTHVSCSFLFLVTFSRHLSSLLYCQCLHALAPGKAATLAFATFSFESNGNTCSKSNWLPPGSRRPKALQSNRDHAVCS